MAPPTPDRIARFRTGLEALIGRPADRFGVAVSGGPDSVALLVLAQTAYPGRIAAATVDHGLRPESRDEAATVAALCAELKLGHSILRPAEPIAGSVQAQARRVRYALLEEWRRERGLEWVLTAHHADDQAETLLMRLNRGSGTGGLRGVRPVNGRVVRPLLGWRRAELAHIVDEAGLQAIADPSNFDERFDRARLRRQLALAPWINAAAFARSAQALAEVDEAVEWAVDRLVAERSAGGAESLRLDARDLPGELRRRLLLRALRCIAPTAEPRGDALTRLLATLEAGGTATLAGVKCSGGAPWRFEPAPPRRPR